VGALALVRPSPDGHLPRARLLPPAEEREELGA
jgi:hypothetical protein